MFGGSWDFTDLATRRYNPPFFERSIVLVSVVTGLVYTNRSSLLNCQPLLSLLFRSRGPWGNPPIGGCVSWFFFFFPASCSIIHRRQINTHSLWFVSYLPCLVYDNIHTDNIQRSYAIKLIPLYCVIQVFSSLQCMRKGAPSVGYRTKSMATCKYW